jgi:kynurenine 3-monooxygenase
MCLPNTAPTTCRVLIAGAGPGGLLLQALLHARNASPDSNVKYDITLIESRSDLGILDKEQLQAHRSWMIGLSSHGLEAVRSLPGLYEKYLSDVGILLTEAYIYLGAKKMGGGSINNNGQEGFIVDRNFIVAALARYAHENMSESPYYRSKYDTELLYVDHDNHRVLIRSKATKMEEYVSYDLLVGADGVRSTVREALVKKHFDFELKVSDIFQNFKAVHIQRPEGVSASSISLLPASLPHFNGISLPETGGLINLSFGFSRNNIDKVADEIKSDDPKVVAQYFKDNFKAFQLTEEGYADLAEQWVGQRWNRTGMVHCNMYHSLPCKIILMGDAAHATSPSIGMGMNTALRDAQKFNELLDKFDDDLEKVLPQYSAERVPEGNSLTDIALNLYCFDTGVGTRTMIKSIIRSGLHYLFPSLVGPGPNEILARSEFTLAQVYQAGNEQGVLTKHREINERIRREVFERQTGMIVEKPKSTRGALCVLAAVTACGAATVFALK